MIHYFYGTAANPFTLAHENIIRYILQLDKNNKVYIGITDHDYKTFEYPFELRKKIVEDNLEDLKDRIVILRQDQRTYKFLSSLHDMIDYIVVGEDEWKDLKDGKWLYSNELFNCWKWKVMPRLNAISSTKVRELIKKDATYEDLSWMISKKTYDILKDEQL